MKGNKQKSDCNRLRVKWVGRAWRLGVDCLVKDLEILGYEEKSLESTLRK